MDPQATLHNALECFADDDKEGALSYLEDLCGWLEKGGFAPLVAKSECNFEVPRMTDTREP